MSRVTTLAAIALGACATPSRAPHLPDESCLSIGAWNDLHGQIGPDSPVVDTGVLPAGGVVALADSISDLRRTSDPVVLLDAGDLFTGPLESTMAEGAPIIEAYRAIGVDAVAVGNHEFDFGPEGYSDVYALPGVGDDAGARGPRGALFARMRSASFPFLAANIHLTSGARPSWPNFFPSIHLRRGTFDIGVVGYTTLETPSTTSRANVVNLDFATKSAESVAAEIRALRKSGASPVILLAHASLDGALPQMLDGPPVPEHGELETLVAALGPDKPDLIIAGHRHAWMLGRVEGVPTVSSDQHGVGLAHIRFCRADDRLVLRSIERVAVVASAPPRTELGRKVDAATAPWVAAVRAKGDALVAVLPRDCPVRSVNGTAGAEQVAESMLARAPVAAKPREVPLVALVNTGAIRAPLRKGPVTYADLFRAFPFETTVAVCGTTRAGFERILRNALRDPSAWKEFPFALAGARTTVEVAPNGTLSLIDFSIDGDHGTPPSSAPIWVTIPDFILDGGDNILEGVECTVAARSSARVRDAWQDVLARDPDGCGGAPHNVVIRAAN